MNFTKEIRVGDFKLGSQRIHNVSSSKDINLTLDLTDHKIDGMLSVSSASIDVKFQFNTITKILVILVGWDVEISDDTIFKINYLSEHERLIENRDNKINELLG